MLKTLHSIKGPNGYMTVDIQKLLDDQKIALPL